MVIFRCNLNHRDVQGTIDRFLDTKHDIEHHVEIFMSWMNNFDAVREIALGLLFRSIFMLLVNPQDFGCVNTSRNISTHVFV